MTRKGFNGVVAFGVRRWRWRAARAGHAPVTGGNLPATRLVVPAIVRNAFDERDRPDGRRHAERDPTSGAARLAPLNTKRQTPNASLARQTLECFSIFLAGLFNYFRRKAGRRRSFIPVKSLEVVANKLFVVTEWAGPDLVTIGRPEA